MAMRPDIAEHPGTAPRSPQSGSRSGSIVIPSFPPFPRALMPMAELSHDDARVRSLLDRVHETTQTLPSELAPLFDEIRGTLRVPFVGTLFRALALDPVLLRSLWKGLAPALRSVESEREVAR